LNSGKFVCGLSSERSKGSGALLSEEEDEAMMRWRGGGSNVDSGSDNSITNVDMPYSKVDTTLGNKKGSLLNYGR
jgi:hypothetical protein